MDAAFVTSLVIVAGLLALLASGVWIFAAMMVISIGGLFILNDYSLVRIGSLMTSVQWKSMTSFELAALPLFVLMGEILFRTRLSEQIFRGLAPWIGWLPGGLLHVVIVACGAFGAVCGSSTATCATISKIALPELKRRGYDEGLAIGSLCAGGTLGILIPPSVIMVIYAVAAEVSLIKLFIAGILPAVVLMVLFSSFIIVWSLFHPEKTPGGNIDMRFRDRLKALAELGPVVTLMVFIFAALFAGWITATETAAWGVFGAILVAVHSGTFNWAAFTESVRAAVRTSCMIIILVAAAGFMSSFMAVAGIPKAVATGVGAMHLSPLALVALLVVVYVVLGMFLDGVSMVLLTLPVALPMVTGAGFDPIWFGIFLIIVIEMGAISPPVGFNLFVLQNITGKNVLTLGWMSLPFFLLMIVLIAVIAVWPQVVMVGPNLYGGG
jgi:tripartite ATP-independent transporter DctM subunit